jgi:DNA-binding response OmpR family regulator
MTIMITDETYDGQEMLTQAIDRIDPEIDIIQARNGEEALQILSRSFSRPDLLLMDINIPFKEGVSKVEDIKNNVRQKDIPVVMYSTDHHSDDSERPKKNGVSNFATKPDTFDGLINSLYAIVKKIKDCKKDYPFF